MHTSSWVNLRIIMLSERSHRDGGFQEEGTQGDIRKLLKLMGVLIILIEVKILGVYTYVHIYQIITLSRCTYCMSIIPE